LLFLKAKFAIVAYVHQVLSITWNSHTQLWGRVFAFGWNYPT